MSEQAETTDRFEPFEDLVPEGSLAVSGVRIVRFADEEGGERFKYQFHGEEHLAQSIGAMVLLIHTWMHDQDDE